MPTSPARPSPALAELAGALLDLAIVALLLGTGIARWAPAEDLPWTPLRLDAPVGLFTAQKFERAARDPARCRAILRAAEVSFSEDRDRSRGACVTTNVVRLEGGTTRLSPASPAMTCGEALA